MVGPWTSTLGNLVLLLATLDLKHDCKITGKIPADCLLDMCMYCIRSDHQSSEDSWHVFLFVCLAKPYGAEVWANEWFLFFFLQLFWCCVHCWNQAKGRKLFWLANTCCVWEGVMQPQGEGHFKKNAVCLWHLLLSYTFVFPGAGPCRFLAPHNLVLPLPKLMRVGLCCPS